MLSDASMLLGTPLALPLLHVHASRCLLVCFSGLVGLQTVLVAHPHMPTLHVVAG